MEEVYSATHLWTASDVSKQCHLLLASHEVSKNTLKPLRPELNPLCLHTLLTTAAKPVRHTKWYRYFGGTSSLNINTT